LKVIAIERRAVGAGINTCLHCVSKSSKIAFILQTILYYAFELHGERDLRNKVVIELW